MKHEGLALAIDKEQRHGQPDLRRTLKATRRAKPLHGIGVVHLVGDGVLIGRATQPAGHGTGHVGAQSTPQLPSHRQPELVSKNRQTFPRPPTAQQGLSVVVSHVYRHHTGDEFGLAHGKFVAKNTTPVVQHESHRPLGADAFDDLTQQLAHVVEAGDFGATFKTGHGQAGTGVSVGKGRYGAAPQGSGIGPAVKHENDFLPLPLQPDFGAVDGDAAFLVHDLYV